jgi:hypothetical protein
MRIFLNPVKDIRDAYENGDFFKGFILSSVYFEFQINQILRNLITDDDRCSLGCKLGMLSKQKLLDELTLEKIREIVAVRNKLVHPSQKYDDKKRRMQDISLRSRLADEEKRLLLCFEECYSKLLKATANSYPLCHDK